MDALHCMDALALPQCRIIMASNDRPGQLSMLLPVIVAPQRLAGRGGRAGPLRAVARAPPSARTPGRRPSPRAARVAACGSARGGAEQPA